eukprot:362386-Alexandrium_andersonii.AAC.1
MPERPEAGRQGQAEGSALDRGPAEAEEVQGLGGAPCTTYYAACPVSAEVHCFERKPVRGPKGWTHR